MNRPGSSPTTPHLSIFVSHPTQFEGPLYPKIARDGNVELEVFFWRTDEPTRQVIDAEVGIKAPWDNLSLTDGYTYSVLPRQTLACWRFIQTKVLKPSERRVLLVNGWRGRAAFLTLLAGVLRRIPIILRLDTVDLYPASKLRSIRRRAVRALVYRIPAAFMVTSTLTQQHLLHRGVPKEAIFFFPYAIDNEFVAGEVGRNRERREELRCELGIAPHDTVIMTALKFVPREGVKDLVQAYAALSDWHNSTTLLLVGDGPLRAELQPYVPRQPGMKVVFTGWVLYSRLMQLYAVSDLFVHPGIEEPWGCSVQEAAACRLPVVSSDLVGAAHDLVRPGENGLVYRGGDVKQLRAALASMLERRSQWPEMGDKSWQIVQAWGHERALSEIKRAVDYVLSSKMPQ
jgi:glycosyltransferase involved in cell wall biosynthesis